MVSFVSLLPLGSPAIRGAAVCLHRGAVPTAPPQNVQAEAVNSTTVHFLWNPPPQQFINGINQGYKVPGLAVEPPDSTHGPHPSCVIRAPGHQTQITLGGATMGAQFLISYPRPDIRVIGC